MKIRKVAGFINYDKSEFDISTPLLDGDDGKLEEIWNKQYPLQPLIGDDQFKSYDELKARLMSVLGSGRSIPASAEAVSEKSTQTTSEPTSESAFGNMKYESEASSDSSESSFEEDDAMSYFEKLANEN